MKKTLFLIGLVIVFNSWSLSVDVGVPSINAICKVSLKNGNIKEGIICIVIGGYEGYHKNGFGRNYSDSEYFTYDLFSVTDYVSGAKGPFTRNSNTGEEKYPDYYFMASQYSAGGNLVSTFNDTTMEHTVTLSTTYKYLALKRFNIYEELPLSLYLPREGDTLQLEEVGNLKRSEINVNDIKQFELIVNPEEKWLRVIKDARNRIYNSGEAWEDYQEPLWYHEIRKDPVLFNEFKIGLGSERIPYPCNW